MSFLAIYTYFIALSFLASLTCYFSPRPNYPWLRLFPPFLLLTLVVEYFSQHMSYMHKSNVALYNPFSVFEFCFYLWIISILISNARVKRIARITILFYIVASIINIVWIDGIKAFHSNSYGLGCLLVVGFCVYYFLELFRVPQKVKLVKSPGFWICTALLLFCCCSFPLIGLLPYWINIAKGLRDNFQLLVNILNIFLYTLFTIAFLCSRIRTYTSSRS